MNKSQDVKAWFLGMKKFFSLHDYAKNMEAIIATFNPKGKENILWGDVKNVRGIHEEELTWNEFERLFKNKYISERYFYDREKELYELNMGLMTDEDYTCKFLELLRYVP